MSNKHIGSTFSSFLEEESMGKVSCHYCSKSIEALLAFRGSTDDHDASFCDQECFELYFDDLSLQDD